MQDASPGSRRTVHLRLFVKEDYEPPKECDIEVPIGCEFKQLHDIVCDNVLGGESERWQLLKETRTPHLGPDGGGHLEIAQEWASKEAALLTHPADDACPVRTLDPLELRGGADVYSVTLGQISRKPIGSQEELDAWWASHPYSGAPLLAAACGRLLAKLRVAPSNAAPLQAAAKLVSEGLAGLRELASDRSYGPQLPLDLVEKGLMAALRWEQYAPYNKPGMLAGILEAASAAAWALVSFGGARRVLVGAGVVPELISALRKAQEWRKVALDRGYSSAASSVMEQMAQSEEARTLLEAAVVEAEKVEQAAAAKSSEGPELEAAIAATDAAADAALRSHLPDSYPILLRHHYIMPAEEVSLPSANRIAYNSLGALAVLAIDARARSACLAVSPQLDFLLVSAITDFPSLNELQFELDVAAWQRRQERRTAADAAAGQRFRRRRAEARERRIKAQQEARERAAQEAAEAAAAAALEAELAAEAAALAASDPELAAILGSRAPSPTNKPASPAVPSTPAEEVSAAVLDGDGGSSTEGEGGEDASAQEDEEEEEVEEEWRPEEPLPDPYPVLEAVAPEDDARVLQVMAAEALYAMLGRERGVRRSFASSGGIVALEALLRSHNDRVVCAAASALASYGRDVGHDHTMGLDMLATAAQPPAPPPPPEPTQTKSATGLGRLRSLAAGPVDAPIEARKDPIVENAGKVVASLIAVLPAVLEALLSSYADGGRDVGTVDPLGVVVSPVPAASDPQVISAAHTDDGGDKDVGNGQSGSAPSPSPTAQPPAIQETPPSAEANATSGAAASTSPQASSKGPDASALARAPPMQRVRFRPHALSYVIEVTATALWSVIAAEQRAIEIRATMSAVAVAETAAEAAATAAAAALAAAAPPLTASSSFSTADGDGTGSLLGGPSSATGPTPQAAAATAAAVAAATAAAAEAMAETDACTTPITTIMLQHVSQLAIATANLVPSEVEEINRRQQLQELQAGGGNSEESASTSGEGGAGPSGGGGTGGRSVSFLNLPDESEEDEDDAGGQQDGSGPGSGGRGSGPPAPPHSHLLGALHALLGVLCVVQSNTRLVKSEFKSLLSRHSELRRLHVRKELAEDEYKALLEEMEIARKQPGQFFFEHEEEAKREKKRAAIRGVEAEMRRALRGLAAAEDALQAAADAAVRAVDATLTLLPYGATADSTLLPAPALPALEQQLRHCHVVAAGVIQAMAATLQPGAVDAAAAANTFMQRAWEAETSASGVFAAAEAAAAVASGERSPESLAAATAAAALYQGPYRELILTSGVLEALLAAATARYTAATSPPVPMTVVAPTTVAVASATAPSTPSPASVGHSSATSRHTTGILRNSIATTTPSGAPERASEAVTTASATSRGRTGGSVSSGSRRGSEGPENLAAAANLASSGGAHGSNASPGTGGHTPFRNARLFSSNHHALDTATNVLLQTTSCALMHLASTESTLQPAQLVAIMSYMHTACHHGPSAPYLSAACYSLSRHVSNRRSMVEGVKATENVVLGLKPAAVTATAVVAETGGTVMASAAARAAAASSSLAPGVWVEVVGALLQGVLVKLRKTPHGSGARISFRAPDAERVLDTFQPTAPSAGLAAAHIANAVNAANTKAAGSASARPMSSHLRMSIGSASVSSSSASAAQAAALTGLLRSGRFLVMAVWLLLRQWVVDKVNPVNMIADADGLYSEGDYSWWSVRFDADTPLSLSSELLEALGLVVEMAQASAVAAAVAAVNAPAAAAAVPTAAGLGTASPFYTSAAAAASPNSLSPPPLTAEPTYHRTHSVGPMPAANDTGGLAKPLAGRGGAKASSTPGSGVAALRRLATRVVWSLSSAHPALAAALVERGSGVLALAAMHDDTPAADSELQALCCGYMLMLASRCPSLLPGLGGLQALSGALVGLVERALAAGGSKNKVAQSSSGESDSAPNSFAVPDGRGVDVPLLEAAVRGLAFLAGHGHEGRVAVTASPAVRRLVAVVRADNGALEAVRRRRREAGFPALSNPEELICPLRAINDLPIVVPAAQTASLAALQPKQQRSPHLRSAMRRPSSGSSSSPGKARAPSGSSATQPSAAGAGSGTTSSSRRTPGIRVSISNGPPPAPASSSYGTGWRTASPEPGRSGVGAGGGSAGLDEELLIQSRQSGEADVGLMALWALLNLSGHEPAQTRICRHGLYTLMAAVHGSADPARSAAARAILTNIHYHPGNATVLYKAELKLKYAALARMLQKEKQSKEAHDAALRRMAASVLAGHTITSVVHTASTSPANANGEPGAAAVDASHRPMSARGGNSQRSLRSGRRNAATEVARQQLSALVVAASRAAAAASPEEIGGMGTQPGSLPTGGSSTASAPATPGVPAVGRAGTNGSMLACLSAALFSAESSAANGGARPSGRSGSGNLHSGVLPVMGSATQSAGLSGGGGLGSTTAGASGNDAGGAEGGTEPVMDPNTIAARVKFLQWVLDPTVSSNLEVPGPSRSAGAAAPEMGSDGWLSEVTAALAASGSGDSDLMSTLTSDPEERHWLEMVTRKDILDELEERQDARCEAGTFMRSVLTRSLAGGANSLWKESAEQRGNKSDSGSIANPRRQVSARQRGASDPAASASDAGSSNRPHSASPHLLRNGISRPTSAAVLPGGGSIADSQRRPGSALRASAPVPSLAWPPAARAAAAAGAAGDTSASNAASMSASATSRFVNLYGIPTGVTPSSNRSTPQPHKPRVVPGNGNGSLSARSVSGGSSTSRRPASAADFSLRGNPWSPHILLYVQDPPSTGGPDRRGDLASRMLTAVAPEYVMEELVGLTTKLMALTAERRREEDEARNAADTAAALAALESAASVRSRLSSLYSVRKKSLAFDIDEEPTYSYLDCRDGPPVGPRGAAAAGTMTTRTWGHHRLKSTSKHRRSLFSSGSSRKAASVEAEEEADAKTTPQEEAANPIAVALAAARSVLAEALVGRTRSESQEGETPDEPLEPRTVALAVSLLPPTIVASPTEAAPTDDDQSQGGSSIADAPVLPAPASVIAGGGTLTVVPSSYYKAGGTTGAGGVTAASVLSTTQASSGLPHDSAASLLATASYDNISTVDPRFVGALHNPADAYRKPHSGLACPPGTRIATLRTSRPNKSVLAGSGAAGSAGAAAEAAAAAASGVSSPSVIAASVSPPSAPGPGSVAGAASYVSRSSEFRPPVAENVPRPVTVLAGSVADLLAAKQAREADAANRLLRMSSMAGAAESNGAGPQDLIGGSALTTTGLGAGNISSGGGHAAPASSAVSAGGANGKRTPRGRVTISAPGGDRGSGGGGGNSHGLKASPGRHSRSQSVSQVPPTQAPPTQAQSPAQSSPAPVTESDDAALGLFRPQPLSVLVATGDGGTDRLYRFPRLLLSAAHHMCLFEHVDGCRFCEALYGHYLLPNGMLAHFYLGDTVVKGHRVDLTRAPDVPFSPADWVADGFPGCTALADWGATTPGRVLQLSSTGSSSGTTVGQLLEGLWCPMPLTAHPLRPVDRCWLDWDDSGRQLQLRSLALEVRLKAVTRTEVTQEIVAPPPPPAPKTKKKKGVGGSKGVSSSRATSGRAGSRW